MILWSYVQLSGNFKQMELFVWEEGKIASLHNHEEVDLVGSQPVSFHILLFSYVTHDL